MAAFKLEAQGQVVAVQHSLRHCQPMSAGCHSNASADHVLSFQGGWKNARLPNPATAQNEDDEH
eukprot:8475519-Alexandrium_andersonii.AAC.1